MKKKRKKKRKRSENSQFEDGYENKRRKRKHVKRKAKKRDAGDVKKQLNRGKGGRIIYDGFKGMDVWRTVAVIDCEGATFGDKSRSTEEEKYSWNCFKRVACVKFDLENSVQIGELLLDVRSPFPFNCLNRVDKLTYGFARRIHKIKWNAPGIDLQGAQERVMRFLEGCDAVLAKGRGFEERFLNERDNGRDNPSCWKKVRSEGMKIMVWELEDLEVPRYPHKKHNPREEVKFFMEQFVKRVAKFKENNGVGNIKEEP